MATLPDVSDFESGRDLSAWLGLTPKPHSNGGKERLGRISKMGNRSRGLRGPTGATVPLHLRRLLHPGAIALANRMARTAYALLKNGTEYQAARHA